VSASVDCGEQKGSLGSLDAAGAGRGSQAGRDRKDLGSREVVGHELHRRVVTFEFYLWACLLCPSRASPGYPTWIDSIIARIASPYGADWSDHPVGGPALAPGMGEPVFGAFRVGLKRLIRTPLRACGSWP